MEAAYYYNLKHGVIKDIKTGDLVLKKNLPTAPTDIPTHLLPRCSGPYEVLEISSMGVRLKHTATGKEVKSSLRHIRPIYLREDSTMSEDGGPTFASNEYVIVKMTSRGSGSDPRWQVAKLNCTQISMRMLGLFSGVTPKTEPAALKLTRSSFSHGVREPIQRKKR